MSSSMKSAGYASLAFLAAVLVAAFSPFEKTLGANARLVYFHGAWVWAAMLAFLASALFGLAALLRSQRSLHALALGWGRSALLFWILFLPQSLWVMQANWNGLFLDEPRFRIPLNFAIVGLLLHIGMALLPLGRWTSLGCLVYGLALFGGMRQVETILHPDSPIFSSGLGAIQVFFIGLVILLSLSAWQLGHALRPRSRSASPSSQPAGVHS